METLQKRNRFLHADKANTRDANFKFFMKLREMHKINGLLVHGIYKETLLRIEKYLQSDN